MKVVKRRIQVSEVGDETVVEVSNGKHKNF